MQIEQTTLELLHKYLQDDGDASEDGFKKFLGTTSDKKVKAYQDALIEKYPEIYGDDEDSEEEEEETSEPTIPKKVAEASACTQDTCCKEKRFLLRDPETGQATEIEIEKESDKSVVFITKSPKDEVDITVAGETLTVDLIKLRTLDKDSEVGGHKVSTLILAAELAKV